MYDIIVVGAGHAGVEACAAAAKLNLRVLLLTLTPDSISYMPCNPSIGGTAKGHIVREIDALGGMMGIFADRNLLQLRMLNGGKGASVQCLRGQADKVRYHAYVKRYLEKLKGLTVLQAEVSELLTKNGAVCGVKTTLGDVFEAKATVLACGVYLNGETIIGQHRKSSGPSGFHAANCLSDSLRALGFPLRRFKTGTPARVNARSLNFSKMERQDGQEDICPFSFITNGYIKSVRPCYLTYTNEKTHRIIRENIALSPIYNGSIKATGPRYCPSIEDKVMRFADKERHQIFIEPESAGTNEMYVQGMSSSMPQNIQREIYQSVAGMENAEIIRYAYAIEYDVIDATALYPTLGAKSVAGLYFAGQINGTSGYEEAAAQGLVAGINAALFVKNGKPLIIERDEGYIGVMCDDLATKGADEPYRMMTARAEYRLSFSQENADLRLTQKAIDIGLASAKRRKVFAEKLKEIDRLNALLEEKFDKNLLLAPIANTTTYRELLRRPDYTAQFLIKNAAPFKTASPRVLTMLEDEIKYEGYLKRQAAQIKEQKRLDDKPLPPDIDYLGFSGLSLESRQKLAKIRPLNLGQASRIPGVTPADITVLMLKTGRMTNGE